MHQRIQVQILLFHWKLLSVATVTNDSCTLQVMLSRTEPPTHPKLQCPRFTCLKSLALVYERVSTKKKHLVPKCYFLYQTVSYVYTNASQQSFWKVNKRVLPKNLEITIIIPYSTSSTHGVSVTSFHTLRVQHMACKKLSNTFSSTKITSLSFQTKCVQ